MTAKAKPSGTAKKGEADVTGVEESTPLSWENFATLKQGFDRHANKFGYVNLTDKKAIKSIAGFLGLDCDVVEAEMKAIDFDANDHVSFAEFVLWADRHTVGIPLGIDVPDKREWRDGMPPYWTTIAPPGPEELLLPPVAHTAPSASAAGASSSFSSALGAATEPPAATTACVPADPDTSELEALMAAAKEFEWDKVWEILGRHPGYVNMRPPERRYAAIHQAAYSGGVAVLRRYVEDFHGSSDLLTRDGQTPEQVALEAGNAEAAKFLAEAAAAAAAATRAVKRLKSRGAVLATVSDAALIEKANDIIEKAKWEKWEEMFAMIKLHPGCQNIRPEYRRYAAIHQVAYFGDADVLRRLVEGGADPNLLTRDKETALQVAKAESNSAAAEYLASLDASGDALLQAAHQVIDAAKNGEWDRTFELLEVNKELVNMRPEVRQYGVIHQAAFHGDIEVLRRLIEDFKANPKMLTKDGKTALDIAKAEDKEGTAKYLEACTPTIKLEDDFIKYPEQQFVKVTDEAILKKFGQLLALSHKASCNWTRDRDWASGKFVAHTPVPTGYELVGAVRNENPALWRIYQVCREVTRLSCTAPAEDAPPWEAWTPLTMEAPHDWSDLGFSSEANEWLLLHASIPEALSAISRIGFTMAKLGSGGTTGSGGLYGDGTYFADSITKADEYARRKVETGEFKGCRAAAICRVLGGRHYYTDKDVQDKDKPGFAKRVLHGHYSSTVGDRLKLKNSFREYVVYDSSTTYLDFILYYRRKGLPKKHE